MNTVIYNPCYQVARGEPLQTVAVAPTPHTGGFPVYRPNRNSAIIITDQNVTYSH